MKKVILHGLVLVVVMSTTTLAQEKTLHSRPDQFQSLMQFPDGEPLFMVNFLKFKAKIEETGETGKDAYMKYLAAVQPFVEKAGAQTIWLGKPKTIVIGPPSEILWDAMIILKFESKQKFFEMIQMDGYPATLREKALSDSRLVAASAKNGFL